MISINRCNHSYTCNSRN